ncbi:MULTISPECIES: hypothetical protein [unclassified Mesorhizobium]|uniref:hypothetical protein n=1 Tax=unclassified Mesorhizobium TaxID=325217 RepID=UPI00112B4625|nr:MULTISPECIES: hypothetical protein [unclassified Mesorhizobium]MBZ9811291.1 hypothetical protein [Mesorhizobium sp. ESP-6-2]TPM25864.1 hypothetical protein FJ955_22685 [Mesorhizobium sp. B2-2-2]
MSDTSWIIGAQLSTSHTALELLPAERVEAIIDAALNHVPLKIIVVGAREAPQIFSTVCEMSRKHGYQSYLWYNLLSDVKGCDVAELVVDWRGQPSTGWGTWNGDDGAAEETFKFICPNNPSARAKTLGQLEYLVTRYPFDGVFLDKCRFPSPANGMTELFSCFCTHCHRAAALRGLDLHEVAAMLNGGFLADQLRADGSAIPAEASWNDRLIAGSSLLDRFMKFRADCVTGLIIEARKLTQRLGRVLALDLFTAGLAPIVGQDYTALSRLSSWMKPMTYRKALGPASLRLEIPALVDGLSKFTNSPIAMIESWAARNIPTFAEGTLGTIRDDGVPVPLIAAEIAAAVRQMRGTPVYAGIETLSYPGVIDVDAPMVRQLVRAAHSSGASGVIASWDLVYTPEENLLALRGDARR